jgi:imidazole glycerol-phosphate synthase subunit HisH
MKTVVIDYGAGNVRSVISTLGKLSISSVLSDDIEIISSADYIIFPGVGHAKSAMEQLKSKNLDQLIPNLKQPVLGICLGMQLLCSSSEEGNVLGLGIFDVPVLKFQEAPKIPHMGWNDLLETKGFCENNTDFFYFVHSYFAPICAHTVASCTYGETFSAALQKDNFYATQFHPEKSSDAGLKLINSFFS